MCPSTWHVTYMNEVVQAKAVATGGCRSSLKMAEVTQLCSPLPYRELCDGGGEEAMG